MARVATLYHPHRGPRPLEDMSTIRWQCISEALAGLGHRVDVLVGTREATPPEVPARGTSLREVPLARGTSLREVPLARADWRRYDAVKTLFHQGWETLHRHGGATHPLVIAKLGSVVGARDMEGIYFYGESRERLFRTQQRIGESARYVTVLNPAAEKLLREGLDRDCDVLVVPGAAPARIPPPGPDPFPSTGADAARPRLLFAGNVYGERSQPEAHRVLVAKLNGLGERLARRGARLHFLGTGDASGLDPRWVRCHRAVAYEDSWRWLQHADVGVVVAAGPWMHNNESTKIYHYLRAGLPVVSEAGFPNDHVVLESGLGFVVANGSLDELAERCLEAAGGGWDRRRAVEYVLDTHTWERRAAVYDAILRQAASG